MAWKFKNNYKNCNNIHVFRFNLRAIYCTWRFHIAPSRHLIDWSMCVIRLKKTLLFVVCDKKTVPRPWTIRSQQDILLGWLLNVSMYLYPYEHCLNTVSFCLYTTFQVDLSSYCLLALHCYNTVVTCCAHGNGWISWTHFYYIILLFNHLNRVGKCVPYYRAILTVAITPRNWVHTIQSVYHYYSQVVCIFYVLEIYGRFTDMDTW